MIRPKFASATALAIAGTLLWAQAKDPDSFVTIDVPGAVSTGAPAADVRLKINPLGQIVG